MDFIFIKYNIVDKFSIKCEMIILLTLVNFNGYYKSNLAFILI